jgi:hypothetical protein
LLVNRLGTFYAGFIANASSSVGAPLTVSGPLNASSTLIVNQLGTFLGGFIANASSSIGANLQVAGIITVSSTATSSFAGSVSTTGNILVGGRLFSSSTEAGLDANCTAGQALNGVKVSGGIVVAGTCSTNAADIAEYYGSNGNLTNGQVVIATGNATSFLDSSGHHQSKAYVDITTGPTTTPIIGVISTNPNIPVLGDGIFTPEENPVPVALAGRVPVLVTNENGPIHVGDRLTISNTIPGYAAKATTSGWTIGTALQSSLSDTTTSTVIVFVNTSWYNANESQSPSSDLSFSFTNTPVNMAEVTSLNSLYVDQVALFHGGLRVDHIAALNREISFYSDTVFIGTPYFNKDTGGFVTFASGTRFANITFEHEYLVAPIVNATIALDITSSSEHNLDPEGDVERVILAEDIGFLITKKSVNGFTILLDRPAPAPIRFSWMALAVDSATESRSSVATTTSTADQFIGDITSDPTTTISSVTYPAETTNDNVPVVGG